MANRGNPHFGCVRCEGGMHAGANTDLDVLRLVARRQLLEQNVQVGFPDGIASLRAEDLPVRSLRNRRDLRSMECFTLDCADTKDMDDAVSVCAVEGGYLIGVHIANVAAYVQPGSELDSVACDRGTSIYLPHMTIPMLPYVLSNDLCSLNEGCDREAISVLVSVTGEGEVRGFEVAPSVVRSRRKMSYGEANAFLAKAATGFAEPADSIEAQLVCMERLAHALRTRRIADGASVYPTNQAKFSFSDGCAEPACGKRGTAERIIEEFAVLANRSVADLFVRQGLPMICRAQDASGLCADYRFGSFSHADLALEKYLHFTSPIRRIADLKVGQVLLDHLEGKATRDVWEGFREHMEAYCGGLKGRRRSPACGADAGREFCRHISKRSRRARNIQWACEKACRAGFFARNAGKVFSGTLYRRLDAGGVLIEMDDYDMLVPGEESGDIEIGAPVEFMADVDRDRNAVLARSWQIWAA